MTAVRLQQAGDLIRGHSVAPLGLGEAFLDRIPFVVVRMIKLTVAIETFFHLILRHGDNGIK
ncbi:MAG: hypothetical protein JWQ17_1299 [Tardiphaga sp.]|nr:hypothetical protein [Tardiphaga sp.]